MSLRSLRNRQESCTYRLNRAALMRMEEGRRKAVSKEGGYYGDRTLCIQVDNKRYSKPDVIQSYSQSENEVSGTEEYWPLSEERNRLRTSEKHHRAKKRDNTTRSNKPRTNRKDRLKGEPFTGKKLRSGSRSKASTTSYKDSELEDKRLNARSILIEVSRQRKRKENRRQQTTQTTSAERRLMAPSLEVRAKLKQHRPKTSRSSSPSSDQQFLERTGSLFKSNTINNHGNVSWASSSRKSYIEKSHPKRENEKEIRISQSDLLETIRMEPSNAAETEPKDLPKRNENRTSQMNPKQPFYESLLIKQQQMNDELFEYLKDSKKHSAIEVSREPLKYLKGSKKHSAINVSREPSLKAIESRESVKKKGKISRRSSSKKRSRMIKPSPGSTRFFFKALPVTMASDQKEVISKWRKRLGTSSPTSPHSQSTNTPILASSFLRDSHIFRVQGEATQAGKKSNLNPMDTNYLIPEKDSPVISLDDVELKKLLGPMSRKRSNEVFSANEEQEIFLRIEMEKTKKHIHYLEELARTKIEKLEEIRWKKKRALEEEAVLNDKLEKLLGRIQELRESDSYAKLLDKQTQVFATKRIRPNIK